MVKQRLVLVGVVVVVSGAALLSGCGDDRASSTTAVSSGGASASSTSTTSSTSVPVDEGAPTTSVTTTTTSAGGTGGSSGEITSAAVQSIVEGQPWAGQIGKVGVSPGSEQIITVVANDESVPAVEVCTTVRDQFVGDHPDVSVNVWFLAAQDTSGEGKQLAMAMSGSACEAV